MHLAILQDPKTSLKNVRMSAQRCSTNGFINKRKLGEKNQKQNESRSGLLFLSRKVFVNITLL